MYIAFIGVALLFFLGHVLKWVFNKTKVPDVLILISLGYVLGPVLKLLTVEDFGKVGPFLTTMALVVILYEGGVRLRARELLQSSLPAAGLSIFGFAFVAALTMLVGLIFQPWPVALLLGLGIGSTSSAVVIPMVRSLSISDKTKTILSLESAFTDVLVIVIFLVIVDGVASGSISAKDLFVGLGPTTLESVLLGIGAGLLWAFFERRFQEVTSILFAGEAWACLCFGIFEWLGFNGAMAVLALGFTLTNLDLLPDWARPVFNNQAVTSEELKLLGEITFLFKTFFFIYLGIAIQFTDWKVIALACVISLFIFLTRYVVVRILMRARDYSRLDAMTITAMGPRGLACAVLAALPVQRGIEGGVWIQNVMYSIIPISIVLTAVFVMLSEQSGIRLRLSRLFGNYREDFGLAKAGIQPQPDGTWTRPTPPPKPAKVDPGTVVQAEPFQELGLVEVDEEDFRKEPTITQETSRDDFDAPPPLADDDSFSGEGETSFSLESVDEENPLPGGPTSGSPLVELDEKDEEGGSDPIVVDLTGDDDDPQKSS